MWFVNFIPLVLLFWVLYWYFLTNPTEKDCMLKHTRVILTLNKEMYNLAKVVSQIEKDTLIWYSRFTGIDSRDSLITPYLKFSTPLKKIPTMANVQQVREERKMTLCVMFSKSAAADKNLIEVWGSSVEHMALVYASRNIPVLLLDQTIGFRAISDNDAALLKVDPPVSSKTKSYRHVEPTNIMHVIRCEKFPNYERFILVAPGVIMVRLVLSEPMYSVGPAYFKLDPTLVRYLPSGFNFCITNTEAHNPPITLFDDGVEGNVFRFIDADESNYTIIDTRECSEVLFVTILDPFICSYVKIITPVLDLVELRIKPDVDSPPSTYSLRLTPS